MFVTGGGGTSPVKANLVQLSAEEAELIALVRQVGGVDAFEKHIAQMVANELGGNSGLHSNTDAGEYYEMPMPNLWDSSKPPSPLGQGNQASPAQMRIEHQQRLNEQRQQGNQGDQGDLYEMPMPGAWGR
jgi:hypothetical protein